MQSFIDLDVVIAQTELDIRFTTLPYNESGLALQKQNYEDSVGACVEVGKSCVGNTLWDSDDKVCNNSPLQSARALAVAVCSRV